jgi:hypothetical protein
MMREGGLFTQPAELESTQEHVGNMTSTGQTQVQGQFNSDVQDNLIGTEMVDSNQAHIAAFDDMAALLGRAPLQSSLPAYLNGTQDAALQQQPSLAMNESQPSAGAQDDLKNGTVVGLEYFIRPPDHANGRLSTNPMNDDSASSVPPGLFISRDALSSKFIGT